MRQQLNVFLEQAKVLENSGLTRVIINKLRILINYKVHQ